MATKTHECDDCGYEWLGFDDKLCRACGSVDIRRSYEKDQPVLHQHVYLDGYWWKVTRMVNYWLTIERYQQTSIFTNKLVTRKVRPSQVF